MSQNCPSPSSAAPAAVSVQRPQWWWGTGKSALQSYWCWSCWSRRTSSTCTSPLLCRTPWGRAPQSPVCEFLNDIHFLNSLLLYSGNLYGVGRGTYRFNHGFGFLVAHRDIMHPVLVTEVTHHLLRSVKHLTEVGEKPETPANKKLRDVFKRTYKNISTETVTGKDTVTQINIGYGDFRGCHASSKINVLSLQGLDISGWRPPRTRLLRSRNGVHLQVHFVSDLRVKNDQTKFFYLGG